MISPLPIKTLTTFLIRAALLACAKLILKRLSLLIMVDLGSFGLLSPYLGNMHGFENLVEVNVSRCIFFDDTGHCEWLPCSMEKLGIHLTGFEGPHDINRLFVDLGCTLDRDYSNLKQSILYTRIASMPTEEDLSKYTSHFASTGVSVPWSPLSNLLVW